MIKYWQQEDGKLVQKEEDELVAEKNVWGDSRGVSRDEFQ